MKSEYLWQGGRERGCRPQDDISLSAPVNSILPPLKNHRVCQGYVTCHTDLHHDMLQSLTQREERWERRKEDTFTHTELSWFSQNLHAERHEPQWSNYPINPRWTKSGPALFSFCIPFNIPFLNVYRLTLIYITIVLQLPMNFAMIVRLKNLMILKNEEQRWERTSELTYAASPVESLIQRALHHMMGNSSQRGSLDLTTACSFKWTQIRFIWDIHIHIFMAYKKYMHKCEW